MILPIVRISFTPGAAVATKSSTRASGPSRPMHRHAQVELQVLLQRRLGVHRHREDAGIAPRAGVKPTGRCSNCAGMSPLASTSTSSTRLPMLGREQRGRRGHRALADAALAREEEAAPVEQVGRRAGHGLRYRAPKPTLRSASSAGDLDVRDLVDRDADAPALRVGEPQQRASARRARALDGCASPRRPSRRPSRGRARGRCRRLRCVLPCAAPYPSRVRRS